MSSRKGVKQSRYQLFNSALFLLLSLKYSYADGNIGCLYSKQLCDQKTEWCYDDLAFGRCVYKGRVTPDDLYKYKFEYDDLETLKQELEELKSLGFSWKHAYMQCNIQTQLYAIKFGVPYNGEICEQILKKDISDPIRILQYQQKQFSHIPEKNRHDLMQADNEGIVKYEPDDEGKLRTAGQSEIYKRLPSDYENELLNQLRLQTNKKPDVYKKSAIPVKSTSSKYRGTPLYLPKHMRNQENNNDVENSAYNDNYSDADGWRPSPENIPYDDILALQKALDMLNSRKGGRAYTEGGPMDISSDKKTEYENAMYDKLLDQDIFGFQRSERLDVKKPGPYYKVNNYAFGNLKAEGENAETNRENDDNIAQGKKISHRNVNTGRQFQEQKAEYEYVPNYGHLSYVTIETNSNLTEATVQTFMGTLKNKYRWPPEVIKKHIVLGGNTLVLTVAPNIFQFSANDIIEKIEEYYSTGKQIAGIEIKKIFVGKPNIPKNLGTSETDQYYIDSNYAYILVKGMPSDRISKLKYASEIVESIRELLHLPKGAIRDVSPAESSGILFRIAPDVQDFTVADIAKEINSKKDEINNKLQIDIQSAGLYKRDLHPATVQVEPVRPDTGLYKLTFIMCGVIAAVLVSTIALYFVKKQSKKKEKLYGSSRDKEIGKEHHQDSFNKNRMTGKGNQDSSAAGQRIASLSRESDNSPSSRSSTSSWSEEPMTNMDITTGHMVLAYMEDHLTNKARLDTEWAALCAYDADPCSVAIAQQQENSRKNRYVNALPYDHARVILTALSNINGSDYINASTITDHDPRNAAYIATQGPLENTICDFWQMIWEQGCVVIVMLTRMVENDTSMCHRYWPLEGAELYNIYEVHLVSEHIWCDDFLVRSFYLKNLKTTETRTVTQFHFLTWPEGGIPPATKPLLEFRRKVNKSFRGRSCPIVVHCSDGVGRTGSYLLLDMVLNRISKGAKEIDIAATLEHIRDQRAGAVCTKQQFQFVLSAVAEEVQAVLKALPQQQQASQDQSAENVAPLVQISSDPPTSAPTTSDGSGDMNGKTETSLSSVSSEQPRKSSK